MLLHDSKLDNQHTNKLADKWGGPYVVRKVLDGGTYVLSELDGELEDLDDLGELDENEVFDFTVLCTNYKIKKGNPISVELPRKLYSFHF